MMHFHFSEISRSKSYIYIFLQLLARTIESIDRFESDGKYVRVSAVHATSLNEVHDKTSSERNEINSTVWVPQANQSGNWKNFDVNNASPQWRIFVVTSLCKRAKKNWILHLVWCKEGKKRFHIDLVCTFESIFLIMFFEH